MHRYIKKSFGILFLALFLQNYSHALEIISLTENTFPGGVIKVVLESSYRCTVQFCGRTYPLFGKDKIRAGYVPVKLGTSGELTLKITEKRFLRKNHTAQEKISVANRQFRKSVVSLDKTKIHPARKKVKYGIKKVLRLRTKKKYYGEFSYPLKNYVISSGFGVRRVDEYGRILWSHKGIDLAAPTGTEVHPVSRGRVALIIKDSDIYGNAVIINHGRGIESFYMHMSKISCTEGEMVDAKSVIGEVGSTGLSTGPHLHLGIYLFGIPVDPAYALRIF